MDLGHLGDLTRAHGTPRRFGGAHITAERVATREKDGRDDAVHANLTLVPAQERTVLQVRSPELHVFQFAPALRQLGFQRIDTPLERTHPRKAPRKCRARDHHPNRACDVSRRARRAPRTKAPVPQKKKKGGGKHFFLGGWWKEPRRHTLPNRTTPPMAPPLSFRDGIGRFALFPVQYDALWAKYKDQEACFWTAEEIDLADDRAQTLTADERRFVESVLGFFAWGDGMVQENLMERFIQDVRLAEARTFYGFQLAMEGIHAETYGLLIEAYVPAERQATIFAGLTAMPCMAAKAAWMQRWLAADAPFAARLLAFAIVEGVFFCGAFAAIFWLKKRGFPGAGLTFSNELISRDESLHTEFATLLYRMMPPADGAVTHAALEALVCRMEPPPPPPVAGIDVRTLDASVAAAFPTAPFEEHARIAAELRATLRLSDARAHAIMREAVDVEADFLSQALPVGLIGMHAPAMRQYTEFVADRLLRAMDHPALYGTPNPFDWMELISLQGKTNFFERRVGEYQKANVRHPCARTLVTDAEF